MPAKYVELEEYELSRDTSSESSQDYLHADGDDAESHLLSDAGRYPVPSTYFSSFIGALTPLSWRRRIHRRFTKSERPHRTRHRTCFRRLVFRRLVHFFYAFLVLLLSTILLFAIFNPSYTHLPSHYKQLRNLVRSSSELGRGNVNQEKIFIAATIRDRHGELAQGSWADRILELVDLLGPENVYLSIYENDAGPVGQAALESFEERLTLPHSLVFEEHLPIDAVPSVRLPDGTDRVKRIAYLAEVRNRALRPLEASNVRYDKLLYMNDIIFNPVDVLQLLFSTKLEESGHTNYRAACAVDFINPFKFYDMFATRDSEGYSMGIPFFPWFSASGEAQSLQDVLDGKDAVRVRSCWGGMVAFDAKFFQKALNVDEELVTALGQFRNVSAPYRFRAEDDLYWEASECCLIQADIQDPYSGDSGIYMNPYVRVAYDSKTLAWLGFTRRFERLYSPIHFLLTSMVGMPWYNPRRLELPMEEVEETVWVPDVTSTRGGSFQVIPRVATNSGFCGRRALSVMKEDREAHGKNWELLSPPS